MLILSIKLLTKKLRNKQVFVRNNKDETKRERDGGEMLKMLFFLKMKSLFLIVSNNPIIVNHFGIDSL